MTLKAVVDAVLATSHDEWNLIHGTGHDSQRVRAVHKHDVAIALEWGIPLNDDFQEPWATKFADPKAASEYIDLLYNGAIVERVVGVAVDGGRCLLPWPTDREGVLVVPGDYAQLIRLVDSLRSAASEFEKYFNRADLHEVTVQMPWRKM